MYKISNREIDTRKTTQPQAQRKVSRMAKATLFWVPSLIAWRLQHLYLNALQRLWFKGSGFKGIALFFLWQEKWTGLFKINAFQRYFHRSFHLLLSLFLIFLKITAVTQVQSLFDHFSGSDVAALWTARHVVWKSDLLPRAVEEMGQNDWQSFPHISHPSQILLQQVSGCLINCYLWGLPLWKEWLLHRQ